METTPPIFPEPEIKPQKMSVPARLMNVFATPSDVFEDVKNSPPSPASWLVPTSLLAIAGIIASVVIFSQPAVVQEIHEQQAKAIDKMVQQGKMTQADADRGLAIAEKFTGPPMLMAFGAVGSVLGSAARVFWWASVLWLLSRWFLKVRFPYMKAVEVGGLAMMISLLGGIVTLLLIVTMQRLSATPSLALLVKNFNPQNKAHLLLGAVNIFNIWLAALMAIGLAKLSGAHVSRAALIVFVYWVAMELFFIGVGLGQFAL